MHHSTLKAPPDLYYSTLLLPPVAEYVEYLKNFTHVTWPFRLKIIYTPERGLEPQ
jgi:hypothetical protein